MVMNQSFTHNHMQPYLQPPPPLYQPAYSRPSALDHVNAKPNQHFERFRNSYVALQSNALGHETTDDKSIGFRTPRSINNQEQRQTPIFLSSPE